MKEYKIAKGWLFFIYAITIAFIIPSTYYLGRYFVNGSYASEPLGLSLFFVLGYIAVLVVLFLGIKDGLQGKFVIDSDKIFSTTSFKYRELYFDEIKGYKKAEKGGLIIEANKTDKKKITISQYFGNFDEIQNWFSTKYIDLDQQEAEQEQEEILSDERLGVTVDERVQKLKKARRLSNILNFGGIGLMVCLYFLPPSINYLRLVCILLPIIGIIISKVSKGLITTTPVDKNSTRPSIFLLLILTSIVLIMTGMLSIHILDYAALWIPLSTVSILLAILTNVNTPDFSKAPTGGKAALLFLSLVWTTAYSYGTIVNLNCYFDKSSTSIYEAKVIGKTISSGKHKSYNLVLSAWGPKQDETQIDVGSAAYSEYEEGETIHVSLKKGAFNIPWYYINH